MPTNKEIFTTKMNALANSINAKAGSTGAKDLDALKTAVDGISVGGAKPSYLISNGNTVSTFYFNGEYDLETFLASLTYSETDPDTGLDVCPIGLGYFYAVDLTNDEYAFVWNDGTNIVPIYATTAVPAYGVTTAGWQELSYSPASAVTVTMSSILAAFVAIMDSVIAKDDIAFGQHNNGKAHTFQIPTISGTYTYTGSSQTPTITGFYADFMSKTGNTSATSAGNYSITISLTDTTNCQWSDGTTAPITLSWSIAKAALPTPTLSQSTINLNSGTTSGTIIVTRNGNGAITATSSNPTKISASVNGTTITITALDTSAESTANITVTVAEGTNYLAYTATDVVCTATFGIIYTVTMYDDDYTTVLQTEQVAAGQMPTYTPSPKGGLNFGYWTNYPGQEVTEITNDTSLYAHYDTGIYIQSGTYIPKANVTQSTFTKIRFAHKFDFVNNGQTYSEKGTALSVFNNNGFYANSGGGATYYKIGTYSSGKWTFTCTSITLNYAQDVTQAQLTDFNKFFTLSN